METPANTCIGFSSSRKEASSMSQEAKEWSPDYDSTWEDDDQPATSRGDTQCKGSKAAKDMHNYRCGYPNRTQQSNSTSPPSPENMPNLSFYRNQTPYEPKGLCIDALLKTLKESEDRLEEHPDCMQWLFPLREPGLNSCAKLLTEGEFQMMKADKDVMRRFLEAYQHLLWVFGMKLLDSKTGGVTHAENWQKGSTRMNSYSHNWLRISRILKCLGDLGYEHYQAPLVRFLLEEILCKNNLQNVKRSALDYFMFTVKNKKERQKLVHFAWMNYKSQEEFVWGPLEKLRSFQGGDGDYMKDQGKDNKDHVQQREAESEDEMYDMKEPGREDSNYYNHFIGEQRREESEEEDSDDMKEPGGYGVEEDDMKEPGGYEVQEDVKEPECGDVEDATKCMEQICIEKRDVNL
ncbi:opioid growth factor receptor-like isoform X1 [Hyperolius riggenbachi]|uniref:opioid growth factor receptor-like isoform X1 n=1 Tax=Hyperolius riggenbachi TaxID=752182 RepID=UPI0035A2CA32